MDYFPRSFFVSYESIDARRTLVDHDAPFVAPLGSNPLACTSNTPLGKQSNHDMIAILARFYARTLIISNSVHFHGHPTTGDTCSRVLSTGVHNHLPTNRLSTNFPSFVTSQVVRRRWLPRRPVGPVSDHDGPDGRHTFCNNKIFMRQKSTFPPSPVQPKYETAYA